MGCTGATRTSGGVWEGGQGLCHNIGRQQDDGLTRLTVFYVLRLVVAPLQINAGESFNLIDFDFAEFGKTG